jgi:arylsulfatase A-like enzyme
MWDSSRKTKPRAIIIVTLDALRADHVGCYGYPLPTTPFVDELAEESIKFEYAFSPIGLTAPSSASLLTGKYPRFHSVEFSNGGKALNREQEVTLPLLLSGLGYSTAAFISIMPLQKHVGLQHGFDYYDDNLLESELNRPQELRRAAVNTTSTVLNWVARNKSEPIFIWVHYSEPHGPYTSPAPYNSMFVGNGHYGPSQLLDIVDNWKTGGIPAYQVLKPERDDNGQLTSSEKDYSYYVSQYDGRIRYVDDQLRVLIERLKKYGLYDDSLIIITSDHGEAMGENDIFFFHSMTVTLDQIHIPLVIKLPDYCKARPHIINEPVSTIDIMLTVLATCNHEANYLGLQGLNLLPHITGMPGQSYPQRYVFSEIPTQLSVISGRFQLLYGKQKAEKYPYPPHLPVVDGTKLIDYVSDPAARFDISHRYQGIFENMLRTADHFIKMPMLTYRETGEELSAEQQQDIIERLSMLGYH